MKRPKRFLAFGLVMLLILLPACGKSSSQEDEDSFLIYYVLEDNDGLESAIEGVEWEGSQDVETIFARLCADPVTDVALVSSIPEDTSLQSWKLEDGILYLDLSGEFGTLTGIELTIADSCLVLTLCQLEEVSGVSITADGETLMEDAVLTPQDVMLTGGEGDTGTLYVTLYFPLSDGTGMGSEERELTITENRSSAESILDALCAGPESKELSSFLPESSVGITLWIEEEICYVNLTEEWQLFLEEDWEELQTNLLCIVNSLAELDDVESVQFLMDGAEIEEWEDFGGDFPLTPSYPD